MSTLALSFVHIQEVDAFYSSDLHFAKSYLDNLEFSKSLSEGQNTDPFCQLKTTLK